MMMSYIYVGEEEEEEGCYQLSGGACVHLSPAAAVGTRYGVRRYIAIRSTSWPKRNAETQPGWVW